MNKLFVLLFIFLGATGRPLQAGYGTPGLVMISPAAVISVVNQVRGQNGLRALNTSSILMATAQTTAESMASVNAGGHSGGIKERVAAAGYGGGTIVWATENFTVGGASTTAQDVVFNDWADDVHRIPMVNQYYCDIGVGISQTSDGWVYIVLHAAYSSDIPCQRATPARGGTPGITPSPTLDYSQLIFDVQTVTPQPDGSQVHTVKQGQSLWAIAIAYGTKIKDIIRLNNLAPDTSTVYIGQQLLIPSPTPGFQSSGTATPEIPGAIQSATPAVTLPVIASAAALQSLTPTPAEDVTREDGVPGAFGVAVGILVLLILLWWVIGRR